MAQQGYPGKKQTAESGKPKGNSITVYSLLFVVLVAVALVVEGLSIQKIGFGPLSVTFGKGSTPSPNPGPPAGAGPASPTAPSAPELTGNQQALLDLVTARGNLSLASDECDGNPNGQGELAVLSCVVPIDSGQITVEIIKFATPTGLRTWMAGQAAHVPEPIPSQSCWSTAGFVGLPPNSDNAEVACYQDQQGVFWVARTFPDTDIGVLSSSGDPTKLTELRRWWDENPLIISAESASDNVRPLSLFVRNPQL